MTEHWKMNWNGIGRKRPWTVTGSPVLLASGWRNWRIWQTVSLRVFVFVINIRIRHPPDTRQNRHAWWRRRLRKMYISQDEVYVTVCSLSNIHDYFSPSPLAIKSLELNLYPLNVPSASSNSPSVPRPQLHPQGCTINHCKESCWSR
jgi:hypothetical protein